MKIKKIAEKSIELVLKATAVAVLSSPLWIYCMNKKEKVISDPEINKKFSFLLNEMKNGRITSYRDKQVFSRYYDIWEKLTGIKKLEKEDEVKTISQVVERYNRIYKSYKYKALKPDFFEDVSDLEKYIKDNEVPYDVLVKNINTSRLTFFGENHSAHEHKKIVLRLFESINKQDLVFMDEFIQVERISFLEKYMNYDDSAFIELGKDMRSSEERIPIMKKARASRVPVMPLDFIYEYRKFVKKEKLGPYFYDPREFYIRENIFLDQVLFALKSDYRIFGVFGNDHLMDDALPNKLKKKGLDPLVISGTDFTEEVYDAGMKVSGGETIFFKRKKKIMCLTKNTRDLIGSKNLWLRKKF